ncbi:MAG: nucleotide-binding universal stress UspA family protein [Paracoccaceae bacterium]|jgi:nucleotide-binding universal stress UspA family protein
MDNKIRSIAVYVDEDAGTKSAVEAAGRLASVFDASFFGVHASSGATAIALAPAAGGMATGVMIDEMQQQAEERARRAKELFNAVTAENSWKADWHRIEANGLAPREKIARAAFLADMVVMSRQDADSPALVTIQDTIVDSGRPVLVHPENWTGPIGEAHAMIAWKPGRQAARAVADALPFLERAARVTVFAATSDEAGENTPAVAQAGELCLFLKKHGIEASAEVVYETDDGDTADALLSKATEAGVDLLVAGAYSHSRLRESIFGGISRDIIEKTTVPALLSH